MLNEGSFYRNMLENIYEGVYFVDKNRKITFWNKGAERISGFLAKEMLNSHCFDNLLNHVDDSGTKLCLNGCPLYKTIEDANMRETSIYLHHKQGHRVPVSVRTIAIKEGDEIVGAVEVFNDESSKSELIKDLENLKSIAYKDQLTSIYNRRYAESFIYSKIMENNNLEIPFGIAYIDIDNFKSFNDTYGHDLGDEVLKMVSNTFSKNIRNTDLISRWGGEEFLAVFPNINENILLEKANKIRMLIENSKLRTESQHLNVTISIGATLYKKNDTIDNLVKRADELLYKSKNQGRNRVTIG